MAKPQILQVTATYIDVATVPKNARTRDALTVSARPVSHSTRAPAAVQAEADSQLVAEGRSRMAGAVDRGTRTGRGERVGAQIEAHAYGSKASRLHSKHKRRAHP